MLLIVTTLLCFSCLSPFYFWYLEEQCFLGGFTVKFIADFGCEISWVGWVLERDSVGFFGLFKGVSRGFLWLVLELFFCFKMYRENFSWLISYGVWLRISCPVFCLQ